MFTQNFSCTSNLVKKIILQSLIRRLIQISWKYLLYQMEFFQFYFAKFSIKLVWKRVTKKWVCQYMFVQQVVMSVIKPSVIFWREWSPVMGLFYLLKYCFNFIIWIFILQFTSCSLETRKTGLPTIKSLQFKHYTFTLAWWRRMGSWMNELNLHLILAHIGWSKMIRNFFP